MKELVPSFRNSLFNSELSDIGIDIAEYGIDSLFENDIVLAIPIVKSVAAIGSFVFDLRAKNALRQTLQFIKTFNSQAISDKKYQEYKTKINNDSKFAEKELGRVLILLDRNIDIEKSALLACIYKAYVNGEINWERYQELSEVNSRLILSDVKLLFDIEAGVVNKSDQCESYRIDRLLSLGLVSSSPLKIYPGAIPRLSEVKVSTIGFLYCKHTKAIIEKQ